MLKADINQSNLARVIYWIMIFQKITHLVLLNFQIEHSNFIF